MKVALTLIFDGSHFCGWQVQKNGKSVQQTVCEAFFSLFGQSVAVTGCSRTDAGVHALAYVCHAQLPTPFDVKKLPAALNFHLPVSVRVSAAREVSADFHARYSAVGKTYRYYIRSAACFSPFAENRAFWVSKPLDVGTMNEDAREYIGEHDFASFMAVGSSVTDTVRTVSDARVFEAGDALVCFEVTADGFLYNQVRIMVGTLIDRRLGRIKDSVSSILSGRDRTLAGFTAPACGLYLYSVNYGENE